MTDWDTANDQVKDFLSFLRGGVMQQCCILMLHISSLLPCTVCSFGMWLSSVVCSLVLARFLPSVCVSLLCLGRPGRWESRSCRGIGVDQRADGSIPGFVLVCSFAAPFLGYVPSLNCARWSLLLLASYDGSFLGLIFLALR